MTSQAERRRRGALARDGAVRRLRRTTQISVAATVALGGAFAVLAAGSTHAKKTIVRVSARRATPAAVLVQAPAPPLVDAQSAAPAPAAPAPPAAAPTPSYQPPVVVSGGS